MNIEQFIKILQNYNVYNNEVYEDISFIGQHLWHNDNQSIGVSIESRYDGDPYLLVNYVADNNNLTWKENLIDFNQKQLLEIISLFKNGRYQVKKVLGITGFKQILTVYDINKNIILSANLKKLADI